MRKNPCNLYLTFMLMLVINPCFCQLASRSNAEVRLASRSSAKDRLASRSNAEDRQIINNVESYTINNGLSDGTVNSILQDKRGYLWVGTMWGLNRYDAKKIKNYIQTGSGNLIDATILSLSEDAAGNIWIGTSNGVSCFNPFTNSFTNYPGGQCIVYADRQNNIWVGDKKLKLLDKDNKTFRYFDVSLFGKDMKQNKYISSILDDKSGRLWIATSYGIKLFDRKTYTWKSYHFDNNPGDEHKVNACTSLFEDSNGNIWCGTWGGGILKYNPVADKFESYLFTAALSNIVFCVNEIVFKNKKYLIAGTSNGLGIFSYEAVNGNNLTTLQILKSNNDNNGLLSNNVNTLFTDHENNCWIGSDKGLQKADPGKQGYQWLDIKEESGKLIFHIVKDIKDKRVVYLTTQQGWWKMDLQTSTITPFPLPEKYKELLCNINNYLITPGGYWFTSQIGFGFYDPYTSAVSDLTNRIDNETDQRTGKLIKDNDGKIWFTVYRNGVRIYDPATNKITKLFADSMTESIKGKPVMGFKLLENGELLLSTSYKLLQINTADHSFTAYKNYTDSSAAASNTRLAVNTIHIDKRKRILLIGEQKILEFKNGLLRELFPVKGITDFIIERTAEDSAGNYWFSTNKGFYKVSPDFQKWSTLASQAGITTSTEISEIFHSENDEVILSSRGRILYFKQQDVFNKTSPPQVMITALTAGDTVYAFPVIQNSRIRLSYKNSLEAELSVLNFSNEKDNRIFYKMNGWDKEWKEAGDVSLIRYEQLPPGSYQLSAKAINGAGIESKEVLLSLTVEPPFWKTWWFRALLIIAAIGIGYGLYKYRINEILRQERLRANIASDLHDDIGATLSSISFYSETLKHQTLQQMPQLSPLLDKMGATSREMVGNMSDIVWAINPKNDNVDHLVSRIQLNAAELCALKNVLLKFVCVPALYSLKLSMEQRRNIYLIYKETINNAFKYSQCTLLHISITEENKNLTLIIKDNGTGFENNNPEGNGIENMKKRAADIKGSLSINSNKNTGTVIKLQLPLT